MKIFATRCQILRLKFTNFDFGWGSAQTPLGSLERSPRPLAGFRGQKRERKGIFKGTERRGLKQASIQSLLLVIAN